MIHPHTELRFISPEVGYGVVATKFIPAGTITWAFDKLDRTFTPEQVHELDPIYQDILEFYSYRDSKGNLILCWDNARFVNHSFKSSCLSTAYDFEIAVRDIHPGEELTDDYGYLNITMPFRGINEGTRRKVVYPNDLLRYHTIWDKELMRHFKNIPKLEQPLGSLLSQQTWAEVHAVCAGQKPMDSILKNHFTS
jgi:hypothetical protein